MLSIPGHARLFFCQQPINIGKSFEGLSALVEELFPQDLKNYTNYPFARLDNNVAERAVRPLTIGGKNWLFFGSAEGGEAGAILFSFVQTCRGLGINPREYLEDIFRRLMSHPAQKLHKLLPDQWQACRKQTT